jgi:hypothetical protein
MVSGLTIATTGLFFFSRLGVDSSYVSAVLLPEILVSIGMGLTFVPMSSTALAGIDTRDAGVASALVNTTQQVGGALGTAFLNTMAATAAANYLASHAKSALATRAAAVHGYTTAFAVSAILLAGSALVAGVIIRTSREQIERDPDTDELTVLNNSLAVE